MIIGADHQLTIGERRVGMYYRGTWHAQPFVVLREATLDEWVDGCIALGSPIEKIAQGRDKASRGLAFFYEISVD